MGSESQYLRTRCGPYFLCFLLFLVPQLTSAQLFKPYAIPKRWAVTGELGGISPVLSMNAEYAFIQSRKSFIVLHAGAGHMFTGYSLFTLPHSITWNIILNGKVRGCPPSISPKMTFAEFGIGGVYLVGAEEAITYRWSPILGIRRYFNYNARATGFWKLQLTPIVAGKLVPWGSTGIGILID